MPKFPTSPAKRGRPKKIPKALLKHLQMAVHEVYMLNHYLEVFFQFRDIVAQSPAENESSFFWEFCGWAFIGELVHRLDRICEKQARQRKHRVHALGAFLMDFRPHVNLVTREHFVVRPNTPQAVSRARRGRGQRPDAYLWYQGNQTFSRFVGKTKASMTEADIDRDLATVARVSKRITRYRNKQLAHIDPKRHRAPPPSVDEIVKVIGVVTRIAYKYSLLVENNSAPAKWTVDISEIFLKPWIENAEAQKKLQAAFKARQR